MTEWLRHWAELIGCRFESRLDWRLSLPFLSSRVAGPVPSSLDKTKNGGYVCYMLAHVTGLMGPRWHTFTWSGGYGSMFLTPFYCFCVWFCLYGPFNCVSFHKFSPQLSAFSLFYSSLISALLVLSILHLFMKVSFSHGLVSWCFEPSQPQRIKSGLNTYFTPKVFIFTSRHTTSHVF